MFLLNSCNEAGHIARDCPNRGGVREGSNRGGGGGGGDRGPMRCRTCNEVGHKAAQCEAY